MADTAAPTRRSPLAHRAPIHGDAGTARLEEAPFLGKFILRADPILAVERLRDALGLGLPFDPLTSSTSGAISFLWMGPDEWMLVTSAVDAAERSGAARQALSHMHHQLVDVSDHYTVIELSGTRARELLMKLTTLDMHHRSFHPGMVTGSVFARANAMIWLPLEGEGGPTFRLFIRWSMADYLWCVLADAGREWGLPEQAPQGGETLTIG